MAVDVCSEISSTVIISPRISFSHDLNADPDIEAAQKYIKESQAAAAAEPDFFFSIISPSKCPHEPCSADEIFSDGKILPTQIKKKNLFLTHQRNSAPAQLGGVGPDAKKIRLKELLECEDEDSEEGKPVAGTKSFWQFRRSSSLNCESGRARSLIKSIQFLSRSKSTGSVPSQKQSRVSRTGQKQNCQKQQSVHINHSDKAQFYYYVNRVSTTSSSSSQKPPLSRTRSYGSGNVRISPVLNMPLPPSYFCRGNASSLFRFGSSLFCSGKDKSMKKKDTLNRN
uniref:Uncharacterized protein n=1 Tax=Kalanchoe fedtschenkoi TaxID=63787 RepID=A0A7N0TKK0_KALFE